MMTHRVPVRFEGDGSGVAELSWGQREMWEAMRRQLSWMPLGYALPVPAETTVDDAVAQLRFMMGRYQSMRTRVRREADGQARQVLFAAGEIDLLVVDAADDDDPAAVAESVRQMFCDADHDFARDWPVRMAIVRHRGVPTHQVVILCHLVTDGFGAMVIMRETGDRGLVTGRRPVPPVTAMEPMAQARWEASPAGQREQAAALRRWEGALRAIPARRFPGPAVPREPHYWRVGLDSAATLLAVRAIRARTTVDASSILLTLFAVSLARVTGADPVVTMVVANNRFRRGLAETVSPITHPGLCVVTLGDATFDEALATVHRRAMTAYRYAYYDPRERERLVARVSAERGEQIDLSCYFNDRRLGTRDLTEAPPPTDLAEVTAALERSRPRWHREDKPTERLFATIYDEPDTLDYDIFGDTHHIAPAGLEACVRGVEALAVAAAFDPSVRVLEKVAT